MKKIIAAILSILTCFLISCGAEPSKPPANEIPENIAEMTEDEIKAEVLEYLKNTYDKEFVIIESEKPMQWNLMGMAKDEAILNIYMASPVDEEDLTFTVYKIKKYDTKEVMFKDTYFEAAKDYVVKKHIDPEGYFVIGNTTPDQVARQVYTLMSRINDELETYGIETNENTCSVTLKFTLGDYVEEISFYKHDFDTIYGQVELALFGGDMYNN